MDCEKIGTLIYRLRKEKQLTQKQVAELMNISDKTISKWERGLGCPDISLLSELSTILGVNIEEILAGELMSNESVGGNMKQIKFFVCPQCQNVMTATASASISCCGRKLEPLEAVKADESHQLILEPVEDEIYVTSDHEMKKNHFISFVAYVTGDKVLIIKQYPEWALQFRFHKFGRGQLYFYCTQHGLYYQLLK
ncbi:MAG TPA: XRE family transcriptional regulator [Firmicutes bacterium]|nr:XRE family transcriptional regulator [Bacillota bacterium]